MAWVLYYCGIAWCLHGARPRTFARMNEGRQRHGLKPQSETVREGFLVAVVVAALAPVVLALLF